MRKLWIVMIAGILSDLTNPNAGLAQKAAFEMIKPSEAAAVATKFDDANVIVRPAKMAGAPLLVWLPGTRGKPEYTRKLMTVVAEQGYRAVGLEYNDVPAVNQVCPKVDDRSCSERFREMRAWGTGGFALVSNSVEESIVARLTALLKDLAKRHPDEDWGAYLTAEGKPEWSKIALAGQSQGAGMAAFLAKKEKVLRVVLFSSPIDATRGRLAPWLSWPSATPADRWYAERNSREPFNAALVESYPVLGVPADHVRVFSLDLPAGADQSNPMAYHGVNIQDPRYEGEWRFLFGDVRAK